MAFGNNAIAVEVLVDTGKAEVTLQQFQQSFQSFTNNYNQTINNIYQLSEKSTWSFSKLATTIADTGFAFANIKAVISSITNFVNGFVQLGDAMDKASLRTGISVESLGGLKFAAEQCGGNFESLTDSIKNFSSTIGAALNGDTGANEKLSKFGLNANDFSGKNAEQQFKILADHLASIQDSGLQAKMAIELFGESGYKILPMLQQGSQGIEKLVAEGRSLGAVMGKETTDSAAGLSDAMNRMNTSVASLSNNFIAMLAPAITSSFNAIARLAQGVQRFISNNQFLITSLGTATVAAVAYTNATLVFNGAMVALSGTIKALTSIGSVFAMNPWATAFIAAAAAVYYFTAGANEAAEVIGSLTDNSSKYSKEVQNSVDVSKRMFDRLQELQRLSQTDTLNNDEVKEAEGLIAALTDAYGDLGVSIDKTTGKVNGMTEAQKKFVQAQKQELVRAAEAEISERNYNIKKLQDRIDDLANNWHPFRTQASKEKELRELYDQKEVEQQKRSLAILKKYNLTHQPEKSESEENLDALTQKNIQNRNVDEKEYNASLGRAESMAQTVADAKLTDYDLKIKKIDEQRQKALNDLEIVRKDAVNKGDKDKIEWVNNQKQEIDAWARTQKNKVNVDFLETQQKERQQAEQKAQQEAQQRAELLAKGENTINPEVAKAENKVNQIQERINQKVLNGEAIDLLKKELDAAKVELARTVATVSGQARIEARTQYEKELREYNQLKRSGVSNEELSAKWKQVEQAQAEWKKQDNEYTSAVGVIQASREASANNQIELARENFESISRGTFNAWEVGSIGNTTAKEQLVTLKNMLNELIELRKNAEEGGIFA